MIEAAERLHGGVEGFLAGMPERRMPEIVCQGQGLGQIVVDAERTADAAGDLGHLDRMGQARPVIIPFVKDENLGLVFEAAEGRAVDHPIPVALKMTAIDVTRLLMKAAATAGAQARKRL